jgi:hypothetical protein
LFGFVTPFFGGKLTAKLIGMYAAWVNSVKINAEKVATCEYVRS